LSIRRARVGPSWSEVQFITATSPAECSPGAEERLVGLGLDRTLRLPYRDLGRLPDAPARAALVGPAATLGVEFQEKAARQVVRESVGYP
jgi:hypothetical protein